MFFYGKTLQNAQTLERIDSIQYGRGKTFISNAGNFSDIRLNLLQRYCQVARSYLKSCSYILKILQIFSTVSIHRK